MKNASNHRQFRTFALAVLLSSGPAAATDRHDSVGTDGGEWVPVKHLTFTGDDVEGSTLSPDGVRIEAVTRARHSSLIEIREGFEAEIVKTMEDM